MNRFFFSFAIVFFSGFAVHAQNSVAVLEKLNSYLPAAIRDGNFYAGVTATGQKCRVQAAYDINTYFVSILFADQSPMVTYHLMIQPTRFEATTMLGQREIPDRALQYDSRWTVRKSPSGAASPQSTDENLLILKEGKFIRMVTLNSKSCMNLRLLPAKPPTTVPLPPRAWEDYKLKQR